MIAVMTGFLGYFAFGETTDTVILLNMPNNTWIGVVAKLFYCFTIMGSFVLLIQPIFYIIERSDWYTRILEPDQEEEHAPIHINENGEPVYLNRAVVKPQSTMQMIVFVVIRMIVVAVVVLTSFSFPNLNLVLTLGGSILGTIMTIVLPVTFYNRAYSMTEKNQKYDKNNYGNPEADEADGLLQQEVDHDRDIEESKNPKIIKQDVKKTDKRRCLKIINYLVLISGCTLSLIGFINACQEIISNPDFKK